MLVSILSESGEVSSNALHMAEGTEFLPGIHQVCLNPSPVSQHALT